MPKVLQGVGDGLVRLLSSLGMGCLGNGAFLHKELISAINAALNYPLERRMVDKKIRNAVSVGVVLLALGMVIRGFANQEGLQLVLVVPTFFIVGIVATGVRRGFLLGLVLFLIFALVNTAIFSPENFKAAADNISIALATFLMLFLIPSLIGGGLSALGGLITRRKSKRVMETRSP